MNIALIEDSKHLLQHRVRGAGFYAENLVKALKKYYPANSYSLSSYDKVSKNDLAHFLYFEPFFRTLPLFKKSKIIVTVHDLTPLVYPKNFPSGIRGKIKWELQKIALKNSDAIITDSESSGRDIIKFTGIDKSKVHVVYLAAGENFKIIKNPKLNFKNLPEKFALYVGDATWNKNLVRLVEAIKKTQIPLVMIGKALVETNYNRKNPWNKDLEKVQGMISSDKNIIRLGFVSEVDLVSLYNKADVFVMPSLYEGFGLPILEAMSCGCPVVTSKEGSIPEIAGDCAYYVDAYDVNSIAKGIKEVFNDKNLQSQLSKKGLIQAKKFSWKKTVNETMNVYRKVDFR